MSAVASAPVICREPPDQPEVLALLRALDEYLAGLYPPDANHILDVQALKADDVRFFVARDAGRPVATAAVRLMAGEAATDGERYGEIKRMFVEPAQRGRGLGAALMTTLHAQLRAEGVALALLETGAAQHEAVCLYEAAGYACRGPFGGYPDNGLSVFYSRRLAPVQRA